MRGRLIGPGGGILLLLSAPLPADVGPPAHLQVTEEEQGAFLVAWRVPKALPGRAIPLPHLPESCRARADPSVSEQPASWLLSQRWTCDGALSGQIVGLRFPFPELALTTVARVDLLSGDRFARIIGPGEKPWRLPEGTAPPEPLRLARQAVLTGALHALGSWAHWALLLAVGLLGGVRRSIRIIGAFSVGQLGAVLALQGLGVGRLGSWPLAATAAEIGTALAVALVAREALRPVEEQRRLAALAAAAGLAHAAGLAPLLSRDLADSGSGLLVQLLAIQGIDAAHLAGVAAIGAVVAGTAAKERFAPARRGAAYVAGGAAMALAVGLALGGGATAPEATTPPVPPTESSTASAATGRPGALRVAPTRPDAPIQSFLIIEPFEVRHEVMLRLAGLAEVLGLDASSTLEPALQPQVAARLEQLVLAAATVGVAAETPPPEVRRVDFMTVDPTGARPRPSPVPEPLSEAVLGIVVAYPTLAMPDEVSLSWDPIPAGSPTIPATVIDPEAASPFTLSTAEPTLVWKNRLVEDPTPTVEAVAVEPLELPVPWLALPLLALAAVLLLAELRSRHPATWLAAPRLLFCLAVLAGPLIETTLTLPGAADRAPSERQARRLLSGLLPNLYRALEYRDEARVYDRLALSVTGETLSEIYLAQRRALEMEERGGAQVRVEAVEVLEARQVEPRAAGFAVRSTWTVGGMVTHFGHRHFRQNRYDARLVVVAVEGNWKIQSIEMLDEERIG